MGRGGAPREPATRRRPAPDPRALACCLVALTPLAAAVEEEIVIEDACDVVISGEQAPPGTLIRLAGPPVHWCKVELDPAMRELRGGHGITILADWVTLDLRGRSLRSASNAAAQADDAGFEGGNIGVFVGGRGVTVTNSSASAVSVVEGFTTNIRFSSRGQASFSSALSGRLIDHDGNPATAPVHNLVAGNAHGGGALAIEHSAHLLVDTVRLADLSPGDEPPAGGSYGVRLRHAEDVTLRNCQIEGVRGGIRAAQVRGLAILANPDISGHRGSGIELGRGVSDALIAGNHIRGNAANGITVGTETAHITIRGNSVRDSGRCGVELRPGAQVTNRARLASDNALSANSRDLCP
jgi:hypothetical protein